MRGIEDLSARPDDGIEIEARPLRVHLGAADSPYQGAPHVNRIPAIGPWLAPRSRITQRQLADVVDVDHVPGTSDLTFRPNQILTVGGLPLSLLDRERGRRVVEAVERRLVTPMGLRSLAPGEPRYAGRYEGDGARRDAVYHQGTVWPWLMGPFADAWVRVRGNTVAARTEARERFLAPLLEHLETAGLGHVSEIADADPPFTPRGCPFHGELLRLDRAILNVESRVVAEGPVSRRRSLDTPVAADAIA